MVINESDNMVLKRETAAPPAFPSNEVEDAGKIAEALAADILITTEGRLVFDVHAPMGREQSIHQGCRFWARYHKRRRRAEGIVISARTYERLADAGTKVSRLDAEFLAEIVGTLPSNCSEEFALEMLGIAREGIPFDIYDAGEGTAPCGGLGGLGDERLEWQTLGIGICRRLHRVLSPDGIKRAALQRARKAARALAMDVALTVIAAGLHRDLSADNCDSAQPRSMDHFGDLMDVRSDWRRFGVALCRRLARGRVNVTHHQREIQVELDRFVSESENSLKPVTCTTKALTMPREIGFMITQYKDASRQFSDSLYTAAKPYCNLREHVAKRHKSYTSRANAPRMDDWESDRYWGEIVTETIYVVKRPENYTLLAKIVVEKAPDAVTTKMMRRLAYEIQGRGVVDAWHKELSDDDARKAKLDKHVQFTEMLSNVWRVLAPVFWARAGGGASKLREAFIDSPPQPRLRCNTPDCSRDTECNIVGCRKIVEKHAKDRDAVRICAETERRRRILLYHLPQVDAA